MAFEHGKQSKSGNMEYMHGHWEQLLSVWEKTLEGFQEFINTYGKEEPNKYSVTDSGKVLYLTENDFAEDKAIELLK